MDRHRLSSEGQARVVVREVYVALHTPKRRQRNSYSVPAAGRNPNNGTRIEPYHRKVNNAKIDVKGTGCLIHGEGRRRNGVGNGSALTKFATGRRRSSSSGNNLCSGNPNRDKAVNIQERGCLCQTIHGCEGLRRVHAAQKPARAIKQASPLSATTRSLTQAHGVRGTTQSPHFCKATNSATNLHGSTSVGKCNNCMAYVSAVTGSSKCRATNANFANTACRKVS